MKQFRINIKKLFLLIPLFSLLTIAGCGEQETVAVNTAYEPATKIEGFGDKEFEQVSPGMSLEQMNQIIGFEAELLGASNEGSIVYETYKWQLNKEAFISGDFENGIAVVIGGWNPRDEYRDLKQASTASSLTANETTSPIEDTYDTTMNSPEREEVEELETSEIPIEVAVSNSDSGLASAEGFGGKLLTEALNRSGFSINLNTYSTQEEEIEALIEGEVSFVIDIDSLHAAQLQNEVTKDGFYILYYTFPYDGVHTSSLVYLTTDHSLGKQLNYIVPEMWKDGTFQMLYQQEYGVAPPADFLNMLIP